MINYAGGYAVCNWVFIIVIAIVTTTQPTMYYYSDVLEATILTSDGIKSWYHVCGLLR
ncbi:MAG: hypothetical protein RI573_17025 [Balneolaceae bacterium]|nr:hypothetical protein [Balneolaceae bacterium]